VRKLILAQRIISRGAILLVRKDLQPRLVVAAEKQPVVVGIRVWRLCNTMYAESLSWVTIGVRDMLLPLACIAFL
jgi:hypothetical protein